MSSPIQSSPRQWCERCGKWAGAHATLPGQSRDHLCMCQPTAPIPAPAPSAGCVEAEALRLAQALNNRQDVEDDAADLIRRQHEQLQAQAAQIAALRAVEPPDDGELEAWRTAATRLRHDARGGDGRLTAAHLLENAYLFASKLRAALAASEAA